MVFIAHKNMVYLYLARLGRARYVSDLCWICQTCVRFVSDLYRISVGIVSNLCRIYCGLVSDVCPTCVGFVRFVSDVCQIYVGVVSVV